MKRASAVLAFLFILAGAAWAEPPKDRVPKGDPPKVGPARPRFRHDFVPGKRARPPKSYHGPKKPLPQRAKRVHPPK